MSPSLNRPLKGADRPTGWCHAPKGGAGELICVNNFRLLSKPLLFQNFF
jgi:hypothetical protein